MTTGSAPAARAGRWRRPAAWCAGLLLAGASVPLGFRAAGADGPTPVPQLLAFLPWLLVPIGVALVLCLAARWRTGAVWAALAAVVTAFFLPAYGDAPGAAPGPRVAGLRVLSANLQFGRATGELLKALRREKPDLVSVQECDRAVCAAALESAELRAAYPYRLIAGDGEAEGSAILSTYPLTPDGEIPAELAMPRARLTVAGRPLLFQVAHPMPPVPGSLPAWRTELGRLRTLAASRSSGPLIIAGDFNSSQDHAAFRAILDAGVHDSARLAGRPRTPSWPAATAPPLGAQIDHILTSDALRARSARFLTLAGSDHRALLVELDLYAAR